MDIEKLRKEIERLSPAERRLLEQRLAALSQDSAQPEVPAAPARAPHHAIPRRANSGSGPLSFSQQRLWFLDQYEPGSGFYNVPQAYRISGPIDHEILRLALGDVIERQEILRTVYRSEAGVPVQLVLPPTPFDLKRIDLSGYPNHERETMLEKLAGDEADRPYDLSRDPMLRACLFRLAPTDHVLLVVVHHIAFDAPSISILFRELSAFYYARVTGQQVPLPALPIQYADYASWQRQQLTDAAVAELLDYWRKRLAGAPEAIELSTDRPRPPVQTFKGDAVRRIVSPALVEQIKTLCRREGVTFFMTLFAAYNVLLFRYSGSDDIVVGAAITGRNQPETEDLIGFFVNTLPLRTDLAGRPTFRELLHRVRDNALAAYAHQDLPFETLVGALKPKRSVATAPLFQTMIVLQNAPATGFAPPGSAVSAYWPARRSAKFDLTLALEETPDGLSAELEYSSELFDAATAKRMLRHFESVLAAAVAEPQQRITNLPLLDTAEQREVLHDWNRTAGEFPHEASIAELFTQQAARTPDAVAIVGEHTTLTYAELDRRSEALARVLRAKGIAHGMTVAICLERSPEMIVAWLAVLKADAAYVPTDPSYPVIRRVWMLIDSQATVLIGDGRWQGRGATSLKHVIDITSVDDSAGESAGVPPERAHGGSLAYIVYTSGSTGPPKGVAVPHRAIARLVLNTDYAQLTPNDVVAQLSNASFDAATFEVWGALLNGARLVVLPPYTVLSPPALAEALDRHRITALFLTTALFNQMARAAPAAFRGVRHLLFGGETAAPDAVRAILQSGAAPERLLHVYGPTETTTFATWHRVDHLDAAAASVPIGRPIANTEIYILDPWLQPVPVGVRGEIFIGGPGLAEGYWRRPKLTAARFVDHPFRAGERLYRTGDVARHRTDGTIEFIGRVDRQVKIRGFRVEPGEIETALKKHPAVADALVIVSEAQPGDRRLFAYVVPKKSERALLRPASIRDHIRKTLPPYMLPSGMRLIEALPLTPNGKIDHAALPPVRSDEIAKPKGRAVSSLEQQLLAIWQELLGRTDFGTRDNFFEIGGHSLLAVRMIETIERNLGPRVPLTTLFMGPTIKELADAIMKGDAEFFRDPLVPLQAKGSRAPFIFLHGDFNGGGFYSLKLARLLGGDRPFYVLHPHGLTARPIPETISEMAEDYLKILRAAFPRGPYALGGHCNGGLVAYEMACSLREQGESVELLAMVDATAWGIWPGREGARQQSWTEPVRRPAADKLHIHYTQAIAGYVPRRYPGTVTVLRPQDAIWPDESLGWKTIAARAEVHVVPGNHTTSVTEHVPAIAEILLRALDSGEGSERAPA